jgi:cell division septation protein DedD
MILPRGYRSPELAYAVEETDERGETPCQLGAFFSLDAAEACLARLESEGFNNLHINMIPIHERLDDWEFDR